MSVDLTVDCSCWNDGCLLMLRICIHIAALGVILVSVHYLESCSHMFTDLDILMVGQRE